MGLWEVFFFPDSSHEFQVITGKAYTSREYLRVFPGKWVFVRVRAVQGDSSGLKKMTLDFDSIGPGATHHRRPGGGRAEGLHPRLPQGRVDAAAHRPRPPLPPGALRGRDRRMNERTIVLISKGFVFFFNGTLSVCRRRQVSPLKLLAAHTVVNRCSGTSLKDPLENAISFKNGLYRVFFFTGFLPPGK